MKPLLALTSLIHHQLPVMLPWRFRRSKRTAIDFGLKEELVALGQLSVFACLPSTILMTGVSPASLLRTQIADYTQN